VLDFRWYRDGVVIFYTLMRLRWRTTHSFSPEGLAVRL